MFAAVTAWRETGCRQQECELGITSVSHLGAIFSQHLCASAVICLSATMHAVTGIATTERTKIMATNCATLCNILILPEPHSGRRLCDQNWNLGYLCLDLLLSGHGNHRVRAPCGHHSRNASLDKRSRRRAAMSVGLS